MRHQILKLRANLTPLHGKLELKITVKIERKCALKIILQRKKHGISLSMSNYNEYKKYHMTIQKSHTKIENYRLGLLFFTRFRWFSEHINIVYIHNLSRRWRMVMHYKLDIYNTTIKIILRPQIEKIVIIG